MSEKIESMAVVAEGIRKLSEHELEQVFGGTCHPGATYCDFWCYDVSSASCWAVCYDGLGQALCHTPYPVVDGGQGCW